jgi:hypothetical protein
MTIADFIIIYLACGSPFAVQILLVRADKLSFAVLAGAATRCLVWPVSASVMFYRIISGFTTSHKSHKLRGIEIDLVRLQTAIERAKFTNAQAAQIFQFRDAYLRYAGLALELNAPESAPSAAELFSVAQHPAPSIASICLQRKNRSRLQLHCDQARVELAALVSQSTAGVESRDGLLRLTIETAERVGDTAWAMELRTMAGFGANDTDAISVGEVGEIWSAASQSHSIAS